MATHDIDPDVSVGLGTVRAATNTASITALVEERILAGSGWRAVEVRRRGVRLEPPEAYWAVYRVRAVPDDAPEGADEAPERDLRLVVRAVFDREAWLSYRGRLEGMFGDRPCDPLAGLGYPLLFDETQHVVWFYPVDPNLTGLARCADARQMRRVFRDAKREILSRPARIHDLRIERQRYLPEISAILRYDIDTVPESASTTVYGKVQSRHRNEIAFRLLCAIWQQSRQTGTLSVPQPLAYWPDLGVFLQSAMPGHAVGSDRIQPVFLQAAKAAADGLASIHEMDFDVDLPPIDVADELDRLDSVARQFVLTHPPAHIMLRDLLSRVRLKLERTAEEDVLPTHGDLKYDQLIHDDGSFGIIDFDYFGAGETSFDLGKFCAHLIPSQPQGWEDTYAAEMAREVFLESYRRARPHATLQRFPVYEAINLANRAMTLMWSQSAGWKDAAETMLVLALERLNTPLPG